MANYLPVEIRDEARKGLQSSDILHRLRAQSAELYAVLDRFDSSAIVGDYLDMRALRKSFERIVAGSNSPSLANEASRCLPAA